MGEGLVGRRGVIAAQLVGRERELELVLAAVAAGRDLLLEGPPGTSKSTMLRAITSSWGIPLLLVEGNADLTPARLIGHHNPARVLQEDYSADNFVAGPLTEAMMQGGFLYIEEFNRTPEDTLNALLTAMAEREISVPRVGRIEAKDSFRLVASMNPYDNVGTTRISASIHDRMCRLAISYQSELDERGIVVRQTGVDDERLVADAVSIVRASRSHPAVSLGSSVRGAIDLALIAGQLAQVRFGVSGEGGDEVGVREVSVGSGVSDALDESDYAALVLDAATLALSGRLTLHRTTDTTPEQIVLELWQDHFVLAPHMAARGEHRITTDDPVLLRHQDGTGSPEPDRRPLTRKPKQLDQPPELYQRSASGGLVMVGDDGDGHDDDGALDQGVSGSVTTSERGEAQPLDGLLEDEPDPEVLAMADRITRALAIRRESDDRTAGRGGAGPLVSMPYRYRSDDIDLDRTIEVLMERPFPDETEVIVRERWQRQRAVALVTDVSGSMRGEKVRIVAATVGALCSELVADELAVVAFWKHAAVLQELGTGVAADVVLRDLLRLPARGLTNVHFGLATGLSELRAARAPQRIGILLSDAVHNAGPDPRDLADRFERLHVLLQVDGEHDAELGRELATAGGGATIPVDDHTQVPDAINELLRS